jgi:hypothetical protein
MDSWRLDLQTMADVLVVSSRLVIVVAPTLANAMFAMSVIEIVDAIEKKKTPARSTRERAGEPYNPFRD